MPNLLVLCQKHVFPWSRKGKRGLERAKRTKECVKLPLETIVRDEENEEKLARLEEEAKEAETPLGESGFSQEQLGKRNIQSLWI